MPVLFASMGCGRQMRSFGESGLTIATKTESEMRNSIFTLCVLALAGSFSMPATAEESGRALLDKARDYVASAPAIRRVDTTEQSAVVVVGQNRMAQKPTTNVVTIEIDMPRKLARQTTTIEGKELIMLKQGEKAAMKLGTGPWEVPAGPFENAALAQERMAKGIAKAFSGNPTQGPTVKVLEYSVKHWVSKSDYRRLQAVQISKVQMSIALADGKRQLIEQSSKGTSTYSYDNVTMEIPEDAQKILSPKTSP